MEESGNNLKYKKEHLVCAFYTSSGEEAVWDVIELKAGKYFIRKGVKRPALVFILTGKMEISTAMYINQKVVTGEMFLISTGDNFYGKASSDTLLMCCSFSRDMALCNRFSIEQLLHFIHLDNTTSSNGIFRLPINQPLFEVLKTIYMLLSTGMQCIHFQRLTMEIVFIVLRGFYNKEELAGLFAPILGEDNDFKDKVLQIYPQINTVKELIERMNMSTTGFKRKFQESFGISAKQWLIQKKKEKLLRDIILSDMTIGELAEKYSLTINYLTAFCKKHFGKSPTELRQEM